MKTTAAGCWHCGEALPERDIPQAVIANVAHPVCCHGCRAAAEWIDQLGLGDYYRLREGPARRAPDAGETARTTTAWARPELARHVVRNMDEHRRESVLLVEGLHCSACVWLIERALGAVPGVASVQVNAAARRARIVWDQRQCALPQIVESFARTGYRALPLDAAALDDTRKRESRTALKRLIVAGFGAMQAMMYASALYLGAFDDADTATRDLFRWLGLLVATPVVFYSARPFFAGALRTLAARRLGMDVPVAIAIALIFVASVVEAFRGGAEVYFDSVSMFVFFLLVGRYLEMRARHRAGDLGDALARLTPVFADRYQSDGSLQRIGAVELVPGDRVHLAEGSSVPADGVLASARCRVDEALLTGESAAVTKHRGATLIAGSIVTEGPAEMRVERVGTDTVLAGIAALVTRAQTARPRLAEAGERAAAGFVARVLTLATITAIGWSFFDPSRAFTATLAVLVVSCPCAFALAVPAALTRALAVLARQGVLVVKPDAIEQLALATHAVFDKTGTLTDPRLGLERVVVRDSGFGIRDSEDTQKLASRMAGDAAAQDEALALAGALARGSRHPVAQALAHAAGASSKHTVEALRAEAGGGLEGLVDGRRLRLGHAGFALAGIAHEASFDDATVLADDSGPIAAFHLSERLRGDACDAIAALRGDGLDLEIASGDSTSKVAAVAARLGISTWHARQRPADKLARLTALRESGARVIAVGDGINDAPVLAGADVAVALSSGADLAQAASDIVLNSERLGALADARRIARETMAILRQNQRWALVYNLSVVPLGALGFVPPWLAALGMSVSSLVVVLNSLRVGRQRGPQETPHPNPRKALA